MGLKQHVHRLEKRAAGVSDAELCSHVPPIVYWPDGTIENVTPHQCGKRRLRIVIGFTDNSDRGTLQRMIELIKQAENEYPDIPAETFAGWIADELCLSPETRVIFFEAARANDRACI